MPSRWKRLHHGLEFGHLAAAIAGTGITGVRTEEVGRVVAPIISEPLLRQMLVGEERMHRHQLDGGDAEPLQILNGRLGRKARISAAKRFRNLGMPLGEAFDVQLVNDGVAERKAERAGPLPNRNTDSRPRTSASRRRRRFRRTTGRRRRCRADRGKSARTNPLGRPALWRRDRSAACSN